MNIWLNTNIGIRLFNFWFNYLADNSRNYFAALSPCARHYFHRPRRATALLTLGTRKDPDARNLGSVPISCARSFPGYTEKVRSIRKRCARYRKFTEIVRKASGTLEYNILEVQKTYLDISGRIKHRNKVLWGSVPILCWDWGFGTLENLGLPCRVHHGRFRPWLSDRIFSINIICDPHNYNVYPN